MNDICVLGAFGYDTNQLDGQTVKTRNVYKLLQKNFSGKLYGMDTIHIRRNPLSAFKLLWYLIRCKTLIIIPCLNNLTYIFPITYFLSKVLRYDIIHICIGGWQVEYFTGNERFKAHPLQLKQSKRIKAFLPEMIKVDDDLKNELGFTNTKVFPNFRNFELRDIPQKQNEELRLVFMARINKKKGYPAIFEVLDRLREEKIHVSMTFYGQIAEEDKDDFYEQLWSHKDNSRYEGALTPNDIQQTLIQYDVMLLPTQYYTEGFPGSILDAYIAGIPVIVTEWKHSHEFVKDGKTGFIVPFEDGVGDMVERIKLLNIDRGVLQKMKNNALEQSKNYSEEAAWGVLNKYL